MIIRIVLADDHELVRKSIASLLCDEPDFDVVGECGDGRQLLALVANLKPNVAIVDVAMPELNGMETARRVREVSPSTRVIALSSYTNENYVKAMLDAGVGGYVVKSGASSDLIKAVRLGSRGKVYLSPEVNSVMWNEPLANVSPQLSPREREVLQLVAEGRSSKEVATKLGISETTVKTHRNHLMDKLGTRDIAGLTRSAIRLGLIRVDD